MEQIQSPVESLVSAAQADGIELQFVSAYRSVEDQQAVVASVINQNIASGMSEAEAKTTAMSVLTEPGYSEHHTGLAIDLVDTTYYQTNADNLLNEAYAETASAKWLASNAPKYGFILRYPKGKEAETGIDFEPWHFRYVGVEHAIYMTQNKLTLEAYINQLKEAGR
nr:MULTISPECIES: M15 family metallopeptidase [unclassified Enterococcus]